MMDCMDCAKLASDTATASTALLSHVALSTPPLPSPPFPCCCCCSPSLCCCCCCCSSACACASCALIQDRRAARKACRAAWLSSSPNADSAMRQSAAWREDRLASVDRLVCTKPSIWPLNFSTTGHWWASSGKRASVSLPHDVCSSWCTMCARKKRRLASMNCRTSKKPQITSGVSTKYLIRPPTAYSSSCRVKESLRSFRRLSAVENPRARPANSSWMLTTLVKMVSQLLEMETIVSALPMRSL
mmetsp:Transcript_25291/g.65225  ORF Transcript_25291/g.65225 Transcript_25291/m.65225 type:complete len:245 (-) Transcript_25291:220-954(-)